MRLDEHFFSSAWIMDAAAGKYVSLAESSGNTMQANIYTRQRWHWERRRDGQATRGNARARCVSIASEAARFEHAELCTSAICLTNALTRASMWQTHLRTRTRCLLHELARLRGNIASRWFCVSGSGVIPSNRSFLQREYPRTVPVQFLTYKLSTVTSIRTLKITEIVAW